MLAETSRQTALQQAIREGRFTEECVSAIFMDLDALSRKIDSLLTAGYPHTSLHTVAVKANPVGKAASFGELQQALRVGFQPPMVVFDSPAKTVQELRFALVNKINMNLDNLQELDRVADLLTELKSPQPGCNIGLRVNPQVGAGQIAALSTAVATSKFGIPLLECRAELLAAFAAHPWLNGLHLHVGSQGVPLELTVEGVARVWELLEEVNAAPASRDRVHMLDIGGGFAVDYTTDEGEHELGYQHFVVLLRQRIPQLFEPGCRVRLVTEYGRSLLAKCCFTASRVEYTKVSGGHRMAVVHVGADLFVRTAYLPATWPVRIFVHDSSGQNKVSLEPPCDWAEQDVVGPLCFQGDRLAEQRHLPLMHPGDFVVIADTGAYSLSMYSRYNSRCSPPVWGFHMGKDGAVSLELLRAADTVEDVLRFWNQGTCYGS